MKKRIVSLLVAAMLILSLLPSAAFAASHASCSGSNCLVCSVADKINALPAADDITLANAATVTEQIHAIDRIKTDLTDDQYDELLTLVARGSDESGSGLDIPVRYQEAVDKVRSLTGGGSLYIVKRFRGATGALIDVTDAEVQLKIMNVATGSAQTMTMATMGYMPNSLSADPKFYLENAAGDGWQYGYILPAGTYRIEEIADSGATVNGKPFVTGSRIFEVDGQQSENSVTVTVEAGKSVSVLLGNTYNSYISVQPVDQSAKVGEDVTFSVVAEGAIVSYQWQINNGSRSANWTDISGATDANYTLSSVTMADNGKQFRRVITDRGGDELITDVVTLYVTEDAPIPTTGDGMELFLFAGLAVIAAFGMVGLRKREQN